MNLQDLKKAAINNDYAALTPILNEKCISFISNNELDIDQDGSASIYPVLHTSGNAFLVVIDVDNTTWMQVCEQLDEAQKVATDMLYDKLMLANEA